jgi:hypothetical protein
MRKLRTNIKHQMTTVVEQFDTLVEDFGHVEDAMKSRVKDKLEQIKGALQDVDEEAMDHHGGNIDHNIWRDMSRKLRRKFLRLFHLRRRVGVMEMICSLEIFDRNIVSFERKALGRTSQTKSRCPRIRRARPRIDRRFNWTHPISVTSDNCTNAQQPQ